MIGRNQQMLVVKSVRKSFREVLMRKLWQSQDGTVGVTGEVVGRPRRNRTSCLTFRLESEQGCGAAAEA